MTNLQAALGLAQLEQLDETVKRKREIVDRYHSILSLQDYFQLPLPETEFARNFYWVFGLVIRSSKTESSEITKKLGEEGIGTRPFFWCMHEQPVFRENGIV